MATESAGRRELAQLVADHFLGHINRHVLAAIVDGEMDQYPEAAFYNVGTLDDVVAKAKKLEDGENG